MRHQQGSLSVIEPCVWNCHGSHALRVSRSTQGYLYTASAHCLETICTFVQWFSDRWTRVFKFSDRTLSFRDRKNLMHSIPRKKSPIEPLAVNSRRAAELLDISTRKLWSLTSPRGPIKSVCIGREHRYAVDELRRFLRDGVARTQGDEK